MQISIGKLSSTSSTKTFAVTDPPTEYSVFPCGTAIMFLFLW